MLVVNAPKITFTVVPVLHSYLTVFSRSRAQDFGSKVSWLGALFTQPVAPAYSLWSYFAYKYFKLSSYVLRPELLRLCVLFLSASALGHMS